MLADPEAKTAPQCETFAAGFTALPHPRWAASRSTDRRKYQPLTAIKASDEALWHFGVQVKGACMEHRFHPRATVEAEAVIFNRGTAAAIGRTRDLSLGGAFVRTGTLNFGRNTPLELELALRTAEGVERHRLAAFVVHSGAEGIGLMFLSANADVRAAIRTAQHLASSDNAPPWARTADTPPEIRLMGGR